MNQEKLYHLFEKSTTALVIFDTQQEIQYVNQTSLQLLAYEKYHLKNQSFSLLIPSSLHSDLDAFIESGQKSFYRPKIQLHGSDYLSIFADISIQSISRQSISPILYLASLYPIHSEGPVFNENKKTGQEENPSDIQRLLILLKNETDIPLNALTTLVDRLLSMQPRSDQLPLLQDMQHSSYQLQEVIGKVLFYANLVQEHIKSDTRFSTLVDNKPNVDVPDLPADLMQGGHSLHGLRILYVDDVIPNHFLMEGLCSIWQVNLDTALNGQEALDKLQQNFYNIILMDLHMPIMNGYETAQRIRHASFLKNSAIPIIAVSGSISHETINQIKKYGMNSLIPKPIKPDELYQKLFEFMAS